MSTPIQKPIITWSPKPNINPPTKPFIHDGGGERKVNDYKPSKVTSSFYQSPNPSRPPVSVPTPRPYTPAATTSSNFGRDPLAYNQAMMNGASTAEIGKKRRFKDGGSSKKSNSKW